MERADELAVETIRGMIDQTLTTVRSDVRFVGLYIFGSFGANKATETSDVDVLVAVKNNTDGDTVEEATALFRHGHYELGGRPLDVVVKREKDAMSYLERACELGDYDTVFDIHRQDYISVNAL